MRKMVGPPYGNDQDNTRTFVKFLCTFYEVILKFNALLPVTSNTYYHEMCEIQSQLIDLATSEDKLLSSMPASMKKKYDKYWGDVEKINSLLFITIVLDPRFKMNYVKYCFGCMNDAKTAAKLTFKVEKTLQGLYVFYNGGEKDKNNANVGDGKGESSTLLKAQGTTEHRKLLDQFLK